MTMQETVDALERAVTRILANDNGDEVHAAEP